MAPERGVEPSRSRTRHGIEHARLSRVGTGAARRARAPAASLPCDGGGPWVIRSGARLLPGQEGASHGNERQGLHRRVRRGVDRRQRRRCAEVSVCRHRRAIRASRCRKFRARVAAMRLVPHLPLRIPRRPFLGPSRPPPRPARDGPVSPRSRPRAAAATSGGRSGCPVCSTCRRGRSCRRTCRASGPRSSLPGTTGRPPRRPPTPPRRCSCSRPPRPSRSCT